MEGRRADLHCHSLYSDGSCRPKELVDMAAAQGFWGLAITDHDSLEAFDEASAYAADRSVVLFPGLEISAQFQGESIHVLGYCFDPKNPVLQQMCLRHREWREERNRLMIQKLAALGMKLSMEEVQSLSPEAVSCGRPHIALALVHHGYVRDVREAFRHFLGSGRSCYVSGKKSTVSEAIDAIHAAGGLAVLAHPHLVRKTSCIHELLCLPFDGLEAYYASMGKEQNLRWVEAAQRRGLFATGGSDFHGTVRPDLRFGSSWAPEPTLDRLEAHLMIEWLYSKRPVPGRKPGLTRMEAALRAIKDPQKNLRAVHVAGTNGKGSVCTKIAKGFELSGAATGLYTSPHIVSFCERIQVNGEPISDRAIVEGISFLRETVPDIEALSFFEITTLLCFWWFVQKGVQIAILETGLGGRFDATNLCLPLLCVITSISLDHTEIFGGTIEAIAAEKAGIVKPGIPLVLGPRVPVEVILREKGLSELLRVEGSWDDFDEENSQVAAAAMRRLDLSEEVIARAIQFRPPCRFQEVPREKIIERWGAAPESVILDVAHNPDGIRHLLAKARAKPCVLFAVSKDKDVVAMAELLLKGSCALICTQTSSPRTMRASELAALVRSVGGTALQIPDPTEAFGSALRLASDRGASLIVTGTFALLGRIFKSLFP